MLAHYAELKFDSLLVNVHIERYDDPLLDSVREITKRFHADIDSIYVGKWLQSVNPFLYAHSLRQRPLDWFVLADTDEFHVYPMEIHALLAGMDRLGFEYVEGCLLDRLARDGGFPEIVQSKNIWEQFPLAGLITYPLLGANMLKVVAAKGFVNIAPGQHSAQSGNGCPRDRTYIPVHHFKWSRGIVDRLRKRAEFYKQYGEGLWTESQRFVDYYDKHGGKINVKDPQFCLSESTMDFPSWEVIKRHVLSSAKLRRR
jgi:hypothetical protein